MVSSRDTQRGSMLKGRRGCEESGRWVVERDGESKAERCDAVGWGQDPLWVGTMGRLSEKVSFNLRSARHKAANQEPPPEIGRDCSASRTQQM